MRAGTSGDCVTEINGSQRGTHRSSPLTVGAARRQTFLPWQQLASIIEETWLFAGKAILMCPCQCNSETDDQALGTADTGAGGPARRW